MALLREVKYLRQYQDPKHPIPGSAAAVFQQDETYRKYLQNLDVIVQLYNTVRETLLDVEYPLVEGQLRELDGRLERAVSELNWTSEGAWEYIEATRNEVRDLEQRVRKAKENVMAMQQVMAEWCATPLYQRREDKNSTLLNLEVCAEGEERLGKGACRDRGSATLHHVQTCIHEQYINCMCCIIVDTYSNAYEYYAIMDVHSTGP